MEVHQCMAKGRRRAHYRFQLKSLLKQEEEMTAGGGTTPRGKGQAKGRGRGVVAAAVGDPSGTKSTTSGDPTMPTPPPVPSATDPWDWMPTLMGSRMTPNRLATLFEQECYIAPAWWSGHEPIGVQEHTQTHTCTSVLMNPKSNRGMKNVFVILNQQALPVLGVHV